MVTLEKKQLGDGSLHVTIVGKIDEKFDGLQHVDAPGKVVVHLGGVRSISSLGVRAFESFVANLGDHEVELIHVSPAIASQITMIPNLCQNAKVLSAKLPFTCPSCGSEKSHSVPWQPRAYVDHAPKCECGALMDLDGIPEQYLPS
jgi:anti-anti-sigma regulatory factor